MKKFKLNRMVVVALIFGLYFLTGCTEKEIVHRKIMPPGYKLQTNSVGKYRWTSRSYAQRIATDKQKAIDMAWEAYEQGEFYTVQIP